MQDFHYIKRVVLWYRPSTCRRDKITPIMRFLYEFQLSNIIPSLLSLDVSHMSCQLVESDKFETSNPSAVPKIKCPEENYLFIYILSVHVFFENSNMRAILTWHKTFLRRNDVYNFKYRSIFNHVQALKQLYMLGDDNGLT